MNGTKQYMKKMERYSDLPEKDGKDISKVSPTTKWRYLKELKTRTQKALWFMQQFGLNIQSLEVQQNDVVRQNITLPQQGSNSVTSASTENNSAFCLSEDEKSQIEKVLLSMDKFGVSKDFYPKLSIVFANLPG